MCRGVIYRVLPNEGWTTLFVSDAIEEMTGYSAQTFLKDGNLWPKIIYRKDFPRISQLINHAITRRQPYAFECRILCADGSLRWIYERGPGDVGSMGELTLS